MISLSAILVTDIVGSTQLAAELRDERWNQLRRSHDATVRKELRRLGGREINTAGDAFLATFEEPELAIACAWSVREAVRRLGLEIRTGIHFGRVERNGRDAGGIALHIASRVVVAAEPGEIVVSSTVHDALAGSLVDFEDRGLHALKGLPGDWRLYSVRAAPPAILRPAPRGWRGRALRAAKLVSRAVAFLGGQPWSPAGGDVPDSRGLPAPPDAAADSSRRAPDPAGGASRPRRRGVRARRRRVQALPERLTYAAICATVLALGVWGLQSQRSVSRLPTDPRLAALVPPVDVRGALAASPGEIDFLVQRIPPGTEVALVDAGGRTLRTVTEPRFSWFHLAVTAACGLAFWIVGAFVFAPRMEQGYIPAFFWAFQLYALAILIGGVHFPPEPLAVSAALPLLRIASLIVLPFLFVYISLIFPRRQPLLSRHSRLVPVALGIAVVLVAWHGEAFLDYVRRPRPEAWRGLRWPELVAGAVLLVGDVAGIVFLSRNLRRAELDREKRQAKWILWGLATGVTPFAFLYVLPQMLGFPPLVPLAVARLGTLTIPLAFGIAVARHRFLDIDIIIRRSLIYGFLAAAAGGVYLLLAVWIARHVSRPSPVADLLPILATAVVVGLLAPTRRIIGRWVDRTVFKIGHRHARALRALRQQLVPLWSQREVAEAVRRFLDEALCPKWAAVLARAGDEFVASGGGEELVDDLRSLADARPEVLQRPLAAPDSTSLPERESADFPTNLLEAGVLLVYPLSWGTGCLGWILVGEKATERRFVHEDLDLLDDVAAEAAAVLEHLDLVNRVAEERTAAQRLKDLDRSKSEFLVRVAQDLRTPLSSISLCAQELADGVLGTSDPRHADYLRAITLSADRLSRLVDDVLEAGRPDGDRRLEMGPVELQTVIEEAVEGLRSTAESRGQRFELRIEPGLPPASGNAAALVEVVTNLLENALRHSSTGAPVKIRLARSGDAQCVEVLDHGPGLGDQGEAGVFEAFQQAAPSPHSAPIGFGLGLHIVRTYVDMMGGTVRARTEPSGGACFSVTLADWPREGAVGASDVK